MSSGSADKRLLLVDDEDLVRDMTTFLLEDSGFTVIPCESGSRAIKLYKETEPAIPAAVIDFSMPEMNGYELIQKLRSLNPKIAIVVISGLAVTAEVQNMRDQGALEFVSKPFENQVLLGALERALSLCTR